VNNFDGINAEFRRAIDLLADGIDCERLNRFLGELMFGRKRHFARLEESFRTSNLRVDQLCWLQWISILGPRFAPGAEGTDWRGFPDKESCELHRRPRIMILQTDMGRF